MKKNNAWNIRRLVDESFVPMTQRPSVLHILKIVGFQHCLTAVVDTVEYLNFRLHFQLNGF